MALQPKNYREVRTLASYRAKPSIWPCSIAGAILILICALMVVGILGMTGNYRQESRRVERMGK